MKYAILSDVHGNLPAMELALEDARRAGAEQFLFVGDYCTRSPWFNEVIALMRTMPKTRIVCGNEESYLHLSNRGDGQFSVTYWTGDHIDPDHQAWLDALPERLDWEDQGIFLHMTHSSEAFTGKAEMQVCMPWRLLQRFPQGTDRRTLLEDIRSRLAQNEFFQEQLPQLAPGVYLFGHTHCQWHAHFGDVWLINPGSCGIPLDQTGTGAAYTLLTIENGTVSVEERRVPYDPEALIEQFRQSAQYASVRVWAELIFGEWRTASDHIMRFLWYADRYAKSIGDERRPFAQDTWDAAYEAWLRDGMPLFAPEPAKG